MQHGRKIMVQANYHAPTHVHEAVGVFTDLSKLDAAISELEHTAFPRHDISVLGNKKEIQERLQDGSIRLEWLEDYPEAPRDISVRPEEKTIGTTVLIGICGYIGGCIAAISVGTASTVYLLAAIAAGSILGIGIGMFAALAIWQQAQKKIQNQIDKGGLLLWVRTPEPEREELAQDIMRRHDGKHVHIHTII
jgi:hypothetical protein